MILNLWSSSKERYDLNASLGICHWGPKRQLFYRARHKQVSDHKVYSRMKILSVIRLSVDKQFSYGYLKEIVVRCANQKEYTFNEADCARLYLNDIEDMYLLYAQQKLHHLTRDKQTDLVTALCFFIRRIVLKKRVEDVQLGLESYQTKLNITRPQSLDKKRPEEDNFHAGKDRSHVADKKNNEELRVFYGWKNDLDGLQTANADRMTLSF
ncbi:hypothetical protein Tco_0174151 [Tanacetum coccineum]